MKNLQAHAEDQQRDDQSTSRVGAGCECAQETRDGYSRAGWLPGLGIQGNFPDASIFRTVLLNTGLYCEGRQGAWRFAEPNELQDPGLARLAKFGNSSRTEQSGEAVHCLSNFRRRRSACGQACCRCSSRARSGRSRRRSRCARGAYVEDILPTVVEDICRNPDGYSLEVLSEFAERGHAAVQSVFSGFDPAVTRQADLIRTSFDCLEAGRYVAAGGA